MYLDFFGLTDPPFRITPNTDYWFEGGQRGDLLATLAYAISHGEGLIKVVGEVGSGKTMLCRMLQQRLPDNIDTVYLGNPTLGADEILAAILGDLGVATASPPNRQILLDQLNSALLARHSNGRRVVAFVEEAQGMSLESLEFLRLLTNLETATDKLLQIVLFGQPELDHILGDPRIRQIRDRITLNLTLPPLTEADTSHYLRSRLQIAGYRGPDLFSKSVVKRIARLSGGLSRRINILADKSMLAAFGNNTHDIRPVHVTAAARDAEMMLTRPAPGHKQHWAWAVAGLLAGLSLLALIAWRDLAALTWQGEPMQPATATAALPYTISATAFVAGVLDNETGDAMPLLWKSLGWNSLTPEQGLALPFLPVPGETEAPDFAGGITGPLLLPVQEILPNTPNKPTPAGERRARSPYSSPAPGIRAAFAHEEPHETLSSPS